MNTLPGALPAAAASEAPRLDTDGADDVARQLLGLLSAGQGEVAAGPALRPLRQRLRRHLLHCCACQHPGVPVPQHLDGAEGRLVFRMAASPAPGARALSELAHTLPWAAEQMLRFAGALAELLCHLEDRDILPPPLSPEVLAWSQEDTALLLRDLSQAGFRRGSEGAPPPATGGSDPLPPLRHAGRLLLWLASATPAVLESPATLDAAVATLGLDILSQLHPDVLRIARRLLQAGEAPGYASAADLLADLPPRAGSGASQATAPAGLPVPLRFAVPADRFGHDDELRNLIDAYAEISTAPAALAPAGTSPRMLVLVEGRSGVGKSAVVRAACKAMHGQGALVGQGKFDQFGSHQPLAPLVEALTQALDDVRRLPAEQGEAVRQRLHSQLGALAGVLSPALPDLALLAGTHEAPAPLAGEAEHTRHELAVRRLIGALACEGLPLVLFIDDLQWADMRTLKLLGGLVNDPGIVHLLLIGAYRGESLAAAPAVSAWIEGQLSDKAACTREIHVQPWTAHDVENMLVAAGAEHAPGTEAAATLLTTRFAGNPFSVMQAVYLAVELGCMAQPAGVGRWSVDLERLGAIVNTGGTQVLISRRIHLLPAPAQQALCDAAYLGPAWSLQTLAAARGEAAIETCHALALAASRGLVDLLDERVAPGQAMAFRFVHDRIQQAAYELYPERQRRPARLRLGLQLLQHAQQQDSMPALRPLVLRQLNAVGASALPTDLLPLVRQLNEAAAQQALSQGAAREALAHWQAALEAARCENVPPEVWPALHFQLTRSAAEAAYLAADFDQAEALLEDAGRSVTGLLGHAQLGELRVQVLLARNRLADALQAGTACLAEIGYPLLPCPAASEWPEVPTLERLSSAAAQDIAGQAVADGALRLLVALTPCAYITSFSEYARVIRTMVAISSHWPASPLTPLSWVNFGLTMAGSGQRDKGFEAGELALQLSQRGGADDVRVKVEVLAHGFLRHGRLPAAPSLEHLRRAYEDCLHLGQQEYLGYAAFLLADKLWSRQPLRTALPEHRARTETVHQFGHDFSWKHCRVWLQGLAALRTSLGDGGLRLEGRHFSARDELAGLQRSNNGFSLFTAHTLQALLAWHRFDTADAREGCEKALGYAAIGGSMLIHADLLVVATLVLADDPARAEACRQQLAALARAAPANHGHQLALVNACRAAAQQRMPEALALFEQAHAAAAESACLRDMAMVEQCWGEALAQAGRRAEALPLLHRAHATYTRWGATGVAEALLSRHPWMQPDESDLQFGTRPLEERVAQLLQGFEARRLVLHLPDARKTLTAWLADDGGCECAVVPMASVGMPPWPAKLVQAALTRRHALAVPLPAQDPRWGRDPYFTQQRPAFTWVAPVYAGASQPGHAYLECDGPRLLMSPNTGAELARQLESVTDSFRQRCAELASTGTRHIDAPTGVPNRAGFAAAIDQALTKLAQAPADDIVLYVLRPKLDPLDGAGFDAEWPDEVLRELIARLRVPERRSLLLGRLEARVFAMAYITARSREEVLADAHALLSRLETPFAGKWRLRFDIGLARAYRHLGGRHLINQVEHLLAEVPAVGPTTVLSDLLRSEAPYTDGTQLLADLEWALAQGGLYLGFDPIVDMTDNRLLGGEALIRWNHPVYGPVAPDRFIGAAERAGLIRKVGWWVMEAFAETLGGWQAAGRLHGRSFSFNVSPLELTFPDYAQRVLSALARYRVPLAAVVLEVTESACLQVDDATQDNLFTLSEAGITLCIDDFGVGMSSLGRLHEFPARRLKIDRSFVEGAVRDPGRHATVTMIARLAEALKMDVIAEGVSRPEHVGLLLASGLRRAQGYLFSRTVTAVDMDRLLDEGHVNP